MPAATSVILEDEACKKICPFSIGNIAAGGNQYGMNGTLLCKGKHCMAWGAAFIHTEVKKGEKPEGTGWTFDREFGTDMEIYKREAGYCKRLG
jgi:hypothetical protein